MESIERDLNEYLFLKFGMEEDEGSVSETWPFSLRRLEFGSGAVAMRYEPRR